MFKKYASLAVALAFPLLCLAQPLEDSKGQSRALIIAGEGGGTNLAPLIKDFELKTGAKVKIVSQGKEELLDFLGSSGADLVVTSVSDELEVAKKRGLLQKLQSNVAEGIPLLHPRLADPDGYWIGYSFRVRSIYFNSKKLTPGEVPTYEELADPKWKGRLCTRNFDQKYNYSFVSWFMAKHGHEKTAEWLKGIRANAVQPDKGGDRDQAAKILRGECDLAVANSYYFSDLLINPKTRGAAADRLGIMIPNQRAGGAFALVNGAAILKGSRNAGLANKFIEHLESWMSQRWLADKVTVYPVRSDVSPSGLLATYGEAANLFEWPMLDPTTIARAAEFREAAEEAIHKAGYVRPMPEQIPASLEPKTP